MTNQAALIAYLAKNAQDAGLEADLAEALGLDEKEVAAALAAAQQPQTVFAYTVHPIGSDHDCTMVATGTTVEAARKAAATLLSEYFGDGEAPKPSDYESEEALDGFAVLHDAVVWGHETTVA